MIEQLPMEDPYPEASTAVAVCELVIPEDAWQVARRDNLSVDRVAEMTHRALKTEVERAHGNMTEAELQQSAVVLKEMKTPDFRRYIAGKLGMM